MAVQQFRLSFFCEGPGFKPWSGNSSPTSGMAWPKQKEKIIFCASGGWEVQDQGPRQCGFWWGPASQPVDGHLLTLHSHGKERAPPGVSSYKDTNPFRPCSMISCNLNASSPVLLSKYSHSGGQGFNTWIWEGLNLSTAWNNHYKGPQRGFWGTGNGLQTDVGALCIDVLL